MSGLYLGVDGGGTTTGWGLVAIAGTGSKWQARPPPAR